MFAEEKNLIDPTEEMQRQESVVIGFLVSLLIRDNLTEEGIVKFCKMTTGINEDFTGGLIKEGLREFYKQYPRQRKGV